MNQNLQALALTSAERHLLGELRSIPESPLKSRILEIVEELVRVGANPRCAEAQADGFPCDCASSPCELCNAVFERLDALSEDLCPPRAAPAHAADRREPALIWS